MISGVMYLAENNCVKKTKELGHEIPFFFGHLFIGDFNIFMKNSFELFLYVTSTYGTTPPNFRLCAHQKHYQIASKFANFIYSMKTNIDQDIH